MPAFSKTRPPPKSTLTTPLLPKLLSGVPLELNRRNFALIGCDGSAALRGWKEKRIFPSACTATAPPVLLFGPAISPVPLNVGSRSPALSNRRGSRDSKAREIAAVECLLVRRRREARAI